MINKSITSQLRSWYSASIVEFLGTPPEAVLGQLAANGDFDLNSNQRDAWLAELEILGSELQGIDGHVFLEFNIPRMGRRVDAILIVGPVVFVIEFNPPDEHVVIFDEAQRAWNLKKTAAA